MAFLTKEVSFLSSGVKVQPPIIETLFENSAVKIDRVTAQGQITPPGEFPDEPSFEFIHLLQGQLVLEYKGQAEKVTLNPGQFAIKTPEQSTRANFTSLSEATVWLKVSYQGKPGKYPFFTGSVGPTEVHPK